MATSPARAPIDVGSVIAGTYKIEALLGRGGMGAVFLANHLRLAGKQVAIKILHTEIADTDVVARFKREAEIAAKLNHPNIVGVIDYNIAPDGTPYLVLDYLQGETLAQRIARGPLPCARSARRSPPRTAPASSTAISSRRTSSWCRPRSTAAWSRSPRCSTSGSRRSAARRP
jgi:serine/threonine protein kinase